MTTGSKRDLSVRLSQDIIMEIYRRQADMRCRGGQECPTGSLNTETGSGCNDHQVLAAVTYLWDVYDDPADTVPALLGCNAFHTDNVGRDP